MALHVDRQRARPRKRELFRFRRGDRGGADELPFETAQPAQRLERLLPDGLRRRQLVAGLVAHRGRDHQIAGGQRRIEAAGKSAAHDQTGLLLDDGAARASADSDGQGEHLGAREPPPCQVAAA